MEWNHQQQQYNLHSQPQPPCLKNSDYELPLNWKVVVRSLSTSLTFFS